MMATIYGPTVESREELSAEFAMSSAAWLRRAQEAREDGNPRLEQVFLRVARIADSVARGETHEVSA